MLNILNREVQRRLFTIEKPDILISYLNNNFFLDEEKIVNVIWTDDLTESLIQFNSCFQETISCKVKSSKDNEWIVQIDVISIHDGKDTSFIKLRDKYFDSFINSEKTTSNKLPFLYIGFLKFKTELKTTYHFQESKNNGRIKIYLIELEPNNNVDGVSLSTLEQGKQLCIEKYTKNSDEINEKYLELIDSILDKKQWEKIDLEYYNRYENQWEERNAWVLKMYNEISSPIITKYLKKPTDEVKISINPLENQLVLKGFSAKREFFETKELQQISFEIFRKWQNIMKLKYPELDFFIKDERVIIEDFRNSLSDAIESLFSTDSFYTQFYDNWDVGYVIGYISGTLKTRWQREYVMKQTNNFKTLCVLQVVRDYLKYNDTLKVQLKDLYKIHIGNNVNIEEYQSLIKQDDLVVNGDIITGEKVGENESIIIAIENVISSQILKTIENKYFKEIDFRIDDIIPQKIIRELINEHKLAANKIL